jgi:hypothetical protein
VSASLEVDGHWLKFTVRYTGTRRPKPTDVHIHLGGRDGPALIGYDRIPNEFDALKGFGIDLPDGNPNVPKEGGKLKLGTSFTVRWTFEDAPHEEIDPDHPKYPANVFEFLLIVAENVVERRGCFIATAAFGSPLEHEVVRLRQWRDEVLRGTLAGRILIGCYALISPPIASLVARRRHGVVGSAIRWAVRKFVRFIDRDR